VAIADLGRPQSVVCRRCPSGVAHRGEKRAGPGV